MTSFANDFLQAAAVVAALGSSSAAFEALSDAEVLAGQAQIATARRLLDTRAAWMAATIARRSRPELGDAGLAARNGFLSPEAMIQTVTGTTRGDAAKLVAVGTMMAHTDAAEELAQATLDVPGADDPETGLPGVGVGVGVGVTVPWQAPIVHALTGGRLSVEAAEAIRKGLGDIDTAVTGEKLAAALDRLLGEAPGLNADQIYKRARRVRDELDAAGILAREKQARDDTVWKVWRRTDGMIGVHALLPPEDGEWVLATYDALTSPRRGGVRFVDTEQAAWADRILHDARTTDQIAADAFVALLKIAVDADPGRVFGGHRPTVRVIVTQTALTQPGPTGQAGHGYLEGNPAPLSWNSIQTQLCNTGTRGIAFDDDGRCVNVGRDERLFTATQRAGLAVRDGGCMWTGCDRPASWTEAHHINDWATEGGRTDIDDGILLCRHHHLLLHHNGWKILRDHARYWLRPPATIDPEQTPIALHSKNPLIRALYDRE